MRFVPKGVSRLAGSSVLTMKSNSPSLLFGVGVAGVVVTTVLACKATLKIEGVLDKAQQDLSNVNDIDLRGPDYDERDAHKDKAYIYVRTTRELVVLYGPAIICGVASIAALTKSHSILNKRNAGLTAAYAAITKELNDYRKRVQSEIGEDRERELYYPLEKCEIEETDPVTGEKTKKEISVRGHSTYAKLFDRNSPSWSPAPEHNMLFLRCQQNVFNQILQVKGHVFLNEVYDSLGMERTTAGAVTGWLKDVGDGYVDFGIFDRQMEPQHLDFFTGHEDAILLDFNVCGPIYKRI